VLTVDLGRLCAEKGASVLDIGSGNGRHATLSAKRGADVVAVDLGEGDLREFCAVVAAMRDAGEIDPTVSVEALLGDASALPFSDESFDVVIASEVLEHVKDDVHVLEEIVRVVRRGGKVGISVPRLGPEALCWILSREYHATPGGHIRIYRRKVLLRRCETAGLRFVGHEYRHGLHSPYWWLRCAGGVNRPERRLVALYHRLLVWDIVAHPRLTRVLDAILNPIIGKSLVFYFERSSE
jgi:SAM-dependent methyltransferase